MAFITARYFRWEVNYFSSPGPIFRTLLLIALPLFPASCTAYVWLRRRALLRFEAPALAGFCGVILLVYQPAATLVIALLFLACLASGIRLARLLNLPLTTPAEVLTLGFGLGCALLIPLLFGLGLMRLYYAPVFALLLLSPMPNFQTRSLLRHSCRSANPKRRLAPPPDSRSRLRVRDTSCRRGAGRGPLAQHRLRSAGRPSRRRPLLRRATRAADATRDGGELFPAGI